MNPLTRGVRVRPRSQRSGPERTDEIAGARNHCDQESDVGIVNEPLHATICGTERELGGERGRGKRCKRRKLGEEINRYREIGIDR